ncbi:MAG: flagellin [Myxococcota bacterium]|nr:flagellin [Myxococcota bacterium]
MAITVRSNPQSIFSQTRLTRTSRALEKTFNRLSSGSRINTAADDAAGLAISTRLEHRIKGQAAAKQNAQEGISFIQTLEGGVEQILDMLHRLRELGVRAANETLTDTDRDALDLEFQQLLTEVDRVGLSTSFNGGPNLQGSLEMTFQVGFSNTTNDRVSLTQTSGLSLAALQLSGHDVQSISNAASAIGDLSLALSHLNAYRSRLGATQNRLERSISNLEADIENATAANSRIRDVDFAEETSQLTRLQILSQSGTAVLTQANAMPQAALALLGG